MASPPAFTNEPVLELRRAPMREALTAGLQAVDARLPLRVPLWIGTERRDGDELVSTDPGDPQRVVAVAASATRDEAAAAVGAAAEAFAGWAQTPAARRADMLAGAAAWMRERRAELAALEVRECAKPWPEADADVCEAIDFLEFYARGAVALERGKPALPGPRRAQRAALPPARRVRGDRPLELPDRDPVRHGGGGAGHRQHRRPQAGRAGARLRADGRRGAARRGRARRARSRCVPGAGEAGAALVEHPGVATIAFTGSGPVGLGIQRAAAEVAPGQRQLKRVVSEMGGKNCVIVDSDADLDEVVPALVSSAFVYAGQKCSAASRVLVHEAIADGLLERLAGAVDVLVVGEAATFGTDVPAVIEADAQASASTATARWPRRPAAWSPCATRSCRPPAGTARRPSPPTFPPTRPC